ncbi:hypothetical protein C0J52_21776 [Blattella germanica]|nr:hypothetical protein C0J52_21776 [Blattella germanica]
MAEDRRKEHIRYCKLLRVYKSAIIQHSTETGRDVDFEKIKVLYKGDQRFPRLIKEAIQIVKHPLNINRNNRDMAELILRTARGLQF